MHRGPAAYALGPPPSRGSDLELEGGVNACHVEYVYESRVGLSRLCRHFFENNRQALAFENNASILGGICSILGEKTISLSLIDSLLLICV